MTPEEQEALSKKYVAPMVLRLDSGDYAILGSDRKLITVTNWENMQYWVDNYTPPAEVRQERPAKRVTVTLTLEDLDL